MGFELFDEEVKERCGDRIMKIKKWIEQTMKNLKLRFKYRLLEDD
jgi:hypothetical protein